MQAEPSRTFENNPETVHAMLNFASGRGDGGIWSNTNRSLITQELLASQVEVRDARRLATPPSLEVEGFQVFHDPLPETAWTDREWGISVYNKHCLEMVQEKTKAIAVAPYLSGALMIRDTGNAARAPAAEFVHLDQTRDSAASFLQMGEDAALSSKYRRTKIFNVWRPITPPPQDVPLALCDQRSLEEADWVTGRTVEPSFPNGVPYLTSVFNARQQWYFFSDLTPDDVMIFKGYDRDPNSPMGCLHGAFKYPELQQQAVPRASVETRIFAFFDA